ncbi:hypothetical protein MTO96_020155 [Rhipicephalus appendiculatus]
MFASTQTIQSLLASLMSMQDILAVLFSEDVSYVLTSKLNQDPLGASRRATCIAIAVDTTATAATQLGVVKVYEERGVRHALRVEFFDQMEVTVDGENVSKEEFEDNTGWRPVGQRKMTVPMPEQRSEQHSTGQNDKQLR